MTYYEHSARSTLRRRHYDLHWPDAAVVGDPRSIMTRRCLTLTLRNVHGHTPTRDDLGFEMLWIRKTIVFSVIGVSSFRNHSCRAA